MDFRLLNVHGIDESDSPGVALGPHSSKAEGENYSEAAKEKSTRFGRQLHSHLRPLAREIDSFDGAVVCVHQSFANCQSQAEAAGRTRARWIAAMKSLEDVGEFLRWNTGSGIHYGYLHHRATVAPHAQCHR